MRLYVRLLVPAASMLLLVVALVAPAAGSLSTDRVGAGVSTAPVWLTSGSTWTSPRKPISPRARVLDLDFAEHPGYDRVVIRLRGSFPDGAATYQRTFTYDGSGGPVPIRGRSGLQVTLSPASGHTDAGTNVYVGPRLARPGLPTLKALALTGDFEGSVGFAFALTHRAVFTLEDPRRLVVDVAHSD